MDDRERPLPYGYLTDDAEELICAIERCAMSAKAKYFMTRVTTRALRHSGFERNAGNPEPGLWCGFDTATWAAENGWTKQYTSYIREQLVDFNLLSWHPIEPGRGKLRVNPDRATWEPLQPDAHTKRYSKPGAGRPRKQTTERNNLEKDNRRASITSQISDSQSALTGTGAAQIQTLPSSAEDVLALAIRNKSDSLRLVDENYSGSLRLPASSEISFVTDACSEASAGQAPELPKKSTKRRERKKGELPADQDGLPGMGFTGEEQQLLEVLRELPTCAANSKQDAHLIRALVYTNKYPIPWLIRQANLMISWALRHPGKRKFDQGYFIQWCGFNAAQEDLPRWKQQQETLRKATQQPVPRLTIAEREQRDAEVRRQYNEAKAKEKAEEERKRNEALARRATQNGHQEGGHSWTK